MNLYPVSVESVTHLSFFVDQRLNLTKDNPDDDDAVRGQLIGAIPLLNSTCPLLQ